MSNLAKLYITLFSVLLCASAQAQTINSDSTAKSGADSLTTVKADTAQKTPVVKKPVVKPRPKRPKPISKEFSAGLRMNTDGWSIFVDKGWVESEEKYSDLFYNIKLAQIELSEKKHPKELKRSNSLSGPGSSDTKPYVYGKINNFYALKFGYGKRKMIAGKPEPGNVSIHWVYLGGVSLGMEKPYYVQAYVQEKAGGPYVQKAITYTDTTKAAFLDEQSIIGGAGFSQGLSEIKFVPGLHAKTGLHFDFASGRTTKLALETGINAEIYTRAIGIMANQKATPYFVDFYVSLQFGKRK